MRGSGRCNHPAAPPDHPTGRAAVLDRLAASQSGLRNQSFANIISAF
jgi:hypothetical protein